MHSTASVDVAMSVAVCGCRACVMLLGSCTTAVVRWHAISWMCQGLQQETQVSRETQAHSSTARACTHKHVHTTMRHERSIASHYACKLAHGAWQSSTAEAYVGSSIAHATYIYAFVTTACNVPHAFVCAVVSGHLQTPCKWIACIIRSRGHRCCSKRV